MKYTTLVNIIIETYTSQNLRGTNLWLGTNNFVNVYKSYPHFDDQFKDRYYGFTIQELNIKLVRSISELKTLRIFR
jgi:hypothetical protein